MCSVFKSDRVPSPHLGTSLTSLPALVEFLAPLIAHFFFFFLNQIIVRRGIVPHIALYWLRSIVRPPVA